MNRLKKVFGFLGFYSAFAIVMPMHSCGDKSETMGFPLTCKVSPQYAFVHDPLSNELMALWKDEINEARKKSGSFSIVHSPEIHDGWRMHLVARLPYFTHRRHLIIDVVFGLVVAMVIHVMWNFKMKGKRRQAKSGEGTRAP